ncbi:hypothetical protein LYNGBM3L_50090 [Moorena producens 3L]|uniref:Uncharacterized protein n=2 Tax=Coleofasciculaceae TaxID=1892251 RepID=F4XY52_9CYAN|nr:hypothetical protein LYNGBM3L_50090 [Moorena producens 3L]OLT68654.1 hypothetical protein BI334_29840 [Moorena producens 3L]
MHISKLATYSFAVLTPWFLGGQAPATANSQSNYKDLGTSVPTVKGPSVNVMLGATPVALRTTDPEIKASPQRINHLGAISNLATPVLGAGIVAGNQVNSVPKVTTETGTTQARLTSTRSRFSSQWLGSSSSLTWHSRTSGADVTPAYTPDQLVSRTLVSQSSDSSESPNSSPIPPSTQEQIRKLQKQLDSYKLAPNFRKTSSISPGFNISNPSGFGADNYRGFVGFGFQSRTRFSNNSGGLIGGGRDGTLGFGFGLGDARDSVGLQLSYTIASFGGSRPLGSGGVNAKLHAQFAPGWAVALGGEGIINVGRLPEGSPTEFNDFENTYYGAVTKVFNLRRNINDPFSRVVITVGAGTGRFRSVEQITNGENSIGFFGSLGVGVLPSVSLITEWTGQDLAIGASIVPFKGIPLVITPAVRDIAGQGDGARFVLGVGGSIGDVLSLVDLIL